jgi:hypothetical protein
MDVKMSMTIGYGSIGRTANPCGFLIHVQGYFGIAPEYMSYLPVCIGFALVGNALKSKTTLRKFMREDNDVAKSEKSSDHTPLAKERDHTNTRSYLVGILLPTGLIALLLMLNAMPTEEPRYGDEWDGGNGWEFRGYRYTSAELVWIKTIEIDPNEDGSYTYVFSNAPGYDLDYCDNRQTMNSTYELTCGGYTSRTGFPEGIWVTGEDYRAIKIGQYTEANTTLWFKPLNDTGVTYEIEVEVIQIAPITFVEIANILGMLFLVGLVGFAFKTSRGTENSDKKSAGEGVLAVVKVGSAVAILAAIGIFLFSVFVGYVAFSSY